MKRAGVAAVGLTADGQGSAPERDADLVRDLTRHVRGACHPSDDLL
jgi:hypothetical protein